jgi:lysyl-tRNA synthetase class 2
MPSTVIRRFSYRPDKRALDVEFVSGRRYRYFGVPEGAASQFRSAFSKGRFFNAHIRDDYPFEELAEDDADADAWAFTPAHT